jgi:hypothetical protein
MNRSNRTTLMADAKVTKVTSARAVVSRVNFCTGTYTACDLSFIAVTWSWRKSSRLRWFLNDLRWTCETALYPPIGMQRANNSPEG